MKAMMMMLFNSVQPLYIPGLYGGKLSLVRGLPSIPRHPGSIERFIHSFINSCELFI